MEIKRLTGIEIEPYISDLAALRIKVFRDYPYCYEGDLTYEENYLSTYVQCPDSIMVIVKDGNNIVGASTAIPLKFEPAETIAPFITHDLPVDTIFYFGESVLLHQYRGQQIGKRFFAEREAAANEQHYSITTFCGVEREVNDPKKPANWHSLESFWQALGYKKHPELKAFYYWKEIGESKQTEKPMIFWMKHLTDKNSL